MTTVVDASVAVKWILPEPGSSAAAALRDEDPNLIAPSFVTAEIGSALWKAIQRGILDRSDGIAAIEAALIWFQAVIPLEDLRARALALAIDLRHPIYDCFYIALAERENARLVTADEAMIAAARKAKIKVRRI
jgi:predicted nucleic acid-binding protein